MTASLRPRLWPTRKDFDPSQHSDEELDRIKLEDGIRIHEDTRVALEIYASNNKTSLVKPFVPVVAKDTHHAGQLKELIASNGFFEGRYAGKVMEIHSNQRGSEKDDDVLKWLRPVKKQFQIYWKHNSRQYVPDFVVETADTIYLGETKKEGDIETADVQEKATVAAEYCRHATDFTTKNNGKPWKYVIIPHNAVLANMGIETLVAKYEFEEGQR